jgi:mannitol 2-dehydrogenase
LFAPDDPEAVLARMVDPETRIVSLTITEGGYHANQATGGFDADDPAIQSDLRAGAVPSTAFGFLTEALARRRAQRVPPFVVMSCDNIQGNGEVAHRMIAAFAWLRIQTWGIGSRSTSASRTRWSTASPRSRRTRTAVARRAVPDRGRMAVVCEPFTQWVVDGPISEGRPPLEDVGVHVVDDVRPYELMKLRLLNASHQAMAYLGYLSGHRYAHEVCTDPLFVDFLLGYMHQRRHRRWSACPAWIWIATVTSSSSASPIATSETPCPTLRGELGPHPPVAGPSHPPPAGSGRPSSAVRRSWSRRGLDTPRASTSPVNRSSR